MILETTILGESRAIVGLRALIGKMADSPSTALITGESGTGKEGVAREMHRLSSRSTKSFVPVNCAAIPKELLESELFGHKKGAFTGAFADRVGRFQLADKGTIFLDEIGDMSSDMQVKLLRVLQERKVDPIGAQREVEIDVRVIAATHRDIQQEIEEGRFREDLFYRLNVLPIHIPPLRERLGDISILFQKFSISYAKGRDPVKLSDDFEKFLSSYDWPGNIRELGNLVDRFSTLFPGQILTTDIVPAGMLPKKLAEIHPKPDLSLEETLMDNQSSEDMGQSVIWSVFFDQMWRVTSDPEKIPNNVPVKEFSSKKIALGWINDQSSKNNSIENTILIAQGGDQNFPSDGLSLRQHLADIEKNLIKRALRRADGNISKTARLLNLQRTTLVEKINKYRLRDK